MTFQKNSFDSAHHFTPPHAGVGHLESAMTKSKKASSSGRGRRGPAMTAETVLLYAPAVPEDRSAASLLAYRIAFNDWIEREVDDEDSVNVAAGRLSEIDGDIEDAPCVSLADAIAKISLLGVLHDQRFGDLSAERSLIDQVQSFLENMAALAEAS